MLAVGRAGAPVGAGFDAGSFGDIVDSQGFGHAAAPVQVGLDVGDAAVFDKLAERDAGVVVFAGG